MSGYKAISIVNENNSVQAIHVKQISTNQDYREEIYTKQLKNEIKESSISLSYWLDIAASIEELHKNQIVHKYLTIESFFINSEDHLILNDITPLNRFIVNKKYDIIYTSPEECNGEEKSFESDMWSVGIIIYTLIFNTPPFHSLQDLFLYINGKYSVNYEGLDKPLINILNGLLNVDKKERLTSIELLEQLSIVPQLSSSIQSTTKSVEDVNNNINSSSLNDEQQNSSDIDSNNNSDDNIYDNNDNSEESSTNDSDSVLTEFGYKILEEIGKGPVGIVYKCKSKNRQKYPLAVKVIKSDDINEVNISLLVSMNNRMDSSIVQIIDSIVKSNQLFIVAKEYDMNLNMYLDKQRGSGILFAEEIICNNFNLLLETLQLIHISKRPHTDIKPNNIFMNNSNNKWLYGDAFIISLFESNEMKQMCYQSNINYIAPEVLKGRKYDLKCDCWSLGCILFEIITLEKVFSQTPIDCLPAFEKIWEGYNKMYKDVIVGLLEPDPEKRLNVEGALAIMQKGRSLL